MKRAIIYIILASFSYPAKSVGYYERQRRMDEMQWRLDSIQRDIQDVKQHIQDVKQQQEMQSVREEQNQMRQAMAEEIASGEAGYTLETFVSGGERKVTTNRHIYNTWSNANVAYWKTGDPLAISHEVKNGKETSAIVIYNPLRGTQARAHGSKSRR